MHQLLESAQELGESAQAAGPLVNSEPPSKRFHRLPGYLELYCTTFSR